MSNGSQDFTSPPEQFSQQVRSPDTEEQAAVPSSDESFVEEAAMSATGECQGFAPNLLQIKAEVEQKLHQQAMSSSRGIFSVNAFEAEGNIMGVGLGISDHTTGGEPGVGALNIYVAEPSSVEQVKAVLVDSMGVSAASSDNLPVNVIVTGIIDAYPYRHKERPAPCGISIGHYKITAGTQGCLARGRTAPRDARILILSNNHVLANSNSGVYGDPILQPGPYDGGVSPRDQVAILERFVPINFSGACNYVDAATAWAWPDRVRREFLPGYYRVSSAPVNCQLNMLVGKSGRTTQLKQGRITDCSATINVSYGNGRVARFCDQIAIRGISGDFSAGGDSGSLIWTWTSSRNPVGLLFAGGGGVTFANKITRVLPALDINLYT